MSNNVEKLNRIDRYFEGRTLKIQKNIVVIDWKKYDIWYNSFTVSWYERYRQHFLWYQAFRGRLGQRPAGIRREGVDRHEVHN